MNILRNLAIVSLVLFVTGCAASRSVVNLEIADEIANPTTGIAVKFVSVEDKRVFELDRKVLENPFISEAEINNEVTKSRLIARKRNGYGVAKGDVFLPDGMTVESLVAGELIKVFRSAGYRVITEDDNDFATAIPIEIEILQFWSWHTWRAGQFKTGNMSRSKVGNVSELRFKGDLGKGVDMHVIENRFLSEPYVAIFDSDWTKTTSNGLKGLMVKVEAYLKS